MKTIYHVCGAISILGACTWLFLLGREITDETQRKTEIDRANYMRECAEYLGPLTCERIWVAGNG